MTRGTFPSGFPGLRLPGLRFHPAHFGETKVIPPHDEYAARDQGLSAEIYCAEKKYIEPIFCLRGW